MTEIEEEFEDFKAQRILKHPDKEGEIRACKTVRELYNVCHEKEGETDTQNDDKPEKTLGVVKHVHELLTKPKDDTEGSDLEGGESLGAKGSDSIPLYPSTSKPQTWESHEKMLDDLFKLETLSKIESTRDKPNREIIEKGEKATKMIEELYASGMKTGRLTRAGKDLQRGRFSFEEPEWFRKLRNPKGRKNPKEKPYLVESL